MMKFERIPQEYDEIEAEFFDGQDIDAVYAFLEKFGVPAEVTNTWVSGPDRGMSRGLKIRTLHGRNSRTLTVPLPCWVAVSGLQWINLYTPEEFEQRFRPKEEAS